MPSLFATNTDMRNSFVILESYTATMNFQDKVEEQILSAISAINSVEDLTDTKRKLVILKAKLEAGITDF